MGGISVIIFSFFKIWCHILLGNYLDKISNRCTSEMTFIFNEFDIFLSAYLQDFTYCFVMVYYIAIVPAKKITSAMPNVFNSSFNI